MCLALSKPAKMTLDKDAMAVAYSENADGCGFAVRINGRVLIDKGLWTFEEFWARLTPYMAYEALVHFRWASAGTISQENCHPFAVHSGSALIHNGHMGSYGTVTQSDTAHWVARVLNPLLKRYPSALTDPILVQLLEDSIGGSKMCLMTPHDTLILNEHLGHERHGVWYSNTSYIQKPAVVASARHRSLIGTKTDMGSFAMDVNSIEDDDTIEEWCEACLVRAATYGVCRHCLDMAEDNSRWNS
jgi:hypothetical protein